MGHILTREEKLKKKELKMKEREKERIIKERWERRRKQPITERLKKSKLLPIVKKRFDEIESKIPPEIKNYILEGNIRDDYMRTSLRFVFTFLMRLDTKTYMDLIIDLNLINLGDYYDLRDVWYNFNLVLQDDGNGPDIRTSFLPTSMGKQYVVPRERYMYPRECLKHLFKKLI